MKNAKPVRLSDCHAFLKKYYRDTWLHPTSRMKLDLDYECTFKIKYINFNFDTRDFVVWRITGRGLGDEFAVSIHDEHPGTILELLALKLELTEPKENENELRENQLKPLPARTTGADEDDESKNFSD